MKSNQMDGEEAKAEAPASEQTKGEEKNKKKCWQFAPPGVEVPGLRGGSDFSLS